jgi:hypothetical protein
MSPVSDRWLLGERSVGRDMAGAPLSSVLQPVPQLSSNYNWSTIRLDKKFDGHLPHRADGRASDTKRGLERQSSVICLPSRGSWASGPPPEMKVSARARPRCCGGTPPSQGGSTGSIPVCRSTAQHNASPSAVLVSETLDFQGRGSRVRIPVSRYQIRNLALPRCGESTLRLLKTNTAEPIVPS